MIRDRYQTNLELIKYYSLAILLLAYGGMMAELKAAGMDQMVAIFNQSLANVIKLWND